MAHLAGKTPARGQTLARRHDRRGTNRTWPAQGHTRQGRQVYGRCRHQPSAGRQNAEFPGVDSQHPGSHSRRTGPWPCTRRWALWPLSDQLEVAALLTKSIKASLFWRKVITRQKSTATMNHYGCRPSKRKLAPFTHNTSPSAAPLPMARARKHQSGCVVHRSKGLI